MVLRPYDHVRITSTGASALAVDRVLGADGSATLPGMPPIFLAGRTAQEAALWIEKQGGFRVGRVGLSLLPPKDAPATFSGAVKRSGALSLRTPKTMRDVIDVAEPLDGADLSGVGVLTALGEHFFVDCEGPAIATQLRPGDQITFEFSRVANEVLVLGAVKEPGSKVFVKGETLEGAIARSGGLTGHAIIDGIRVLRDGQPVAGSGWTEAGKQTILKRGDLVQVPTADNGRYVSVTGFVKSQGLVPFRPGMTLLEAISAAGGTTVGAGLSDVEIRKVFGGQGKTKKYDISRIKKGSPNDPKLVAADIVFVPAFVFKGVPTQNSGFRPVVPPRRRP